ncbi:DUF2752 domain-containing protein [Prevotella sp. OH937_COT-195]|uniref:DUF2752 domain-containing protein n=1 Tax=Prevotella sp. OH937_COT-195 TaxID=2491051 RepID=UPI000F64DDFC|nr:DUF2752 domain-containing protein [Prevotella sp. OH937_COT-195]RRD00827.1 DUF2752 domain-containing protein [Prevotella sp. OH937_COT-195]
MRVPSRKHKITLAAAVLIALAAVYFFFDPNTDILFPKCAFHVITGWKCPGCGSQRALHAMLHGNIYTALKHNLWIPFAITYMILIITAKLLGKHGKRLNDFLTNKYLFVIFIIFTILWCVLRNVIAI